MFDPQRAISPTFILDRSQAREELLSARRHLEHARHDRPDEDAVMMWLERAVIGFLEAGGEVGRGALCEGLPES